MDLTGIQPIHMSHQAFRRNAYASYGGAPLVNPVTACGLVGLWIAWCQVGPIQSPCNLCVYMTSIGRQLVDSVPSPRLVILLQSPCWYSALSIRMYGRCNKYCQNHNLVIRFFEARIAHLPKACI